MELQGLHHVTMITADAPRNVDFYADLLGLRLVKKTVNFDQPERIPPVLRRRARDARVDPDLVRVPRRGAGAGRRRNDPHDRARRRLGATHWTSGSDRLGRARAPESRSDGAGCASRTRTACGSLVGLAAAGNPPLSAEHPEDPGRACDPGVEGARAYPARGLMPSDLLTDDARIHRPWRRHLPPRR